MSGINNPTLALFNMETKHPLVRNSTARLLSRILRAEADSPLYAQFVLEKDLGLREGRVHRLERQLKQCLKYGTNLPPQVRADALNALHGKKP